MQEPIQTPWGDSQDVEKISHGLKFVATSGHGGIKVNDELNNKIPNWVKERTFRKLGLAGWYEEDCDWCIPVIVFSKVFHAWAEEEGPDAYIACAHKMFKDAFMSGNTNDDADLFELTDFCREYGIEIK